MDENSLKQEIQTVDERVTALVVSTPETYQIAGEAVIELDALKKRITEYWDEPIRKAYETHRALTAKRAEMIKPIDDRQKAIRADISKYLTAQERARKEEQSRLDAERRRQEEAERDKLLKAAAKADEKGNAEKAEALLNKAEDVYVAPVIAVPEVEKTTRMDAGTATAKKDVRVTVVDPMKVLCAIVAGQLPINVVAINETKIKAYVKLTGATHVNGCEIEEIVSAQFRRKVG